MSEPGSFTVVIPAYNEAATIRDVVTRVLCHIARVIVVDDGSHDDTAAIVATLPVRLLRQARNTGKAAGLRRGMAKALADGADAVLTLDGDGQHAPEDIPALLEMHRRFPRALVIGTRRHERCPVPRARYYANRVADFWISWAAGQPISDTQSGFRLYPAELLRAIGPACDRAAGFVYESEILIEAGRRGWSIVSVPVAAIYGRHLRRSHFRQVEDITLIVRMVGWKLISRGLCVPGLVRSLGTPIVRNDHKCP
jgi:glycosyltransferase involved in cell wall biosynthesis